MSRGGGTGTKKDVLLELVSRDIKELQRVHSESKSSDVKAFTEAEEPAQLLCDHLDHILMHGLREFEDGYWPFVRHFTRNELVQRIRQLKRVTTSVGRGRSWLYTALNEQSVESYIRMFAENQDIVEGFYLRYQLYYAPVLCSGTPLIWIPMGQKKVSVLVRCPYFMVQRTVVGE
ncbi:Pleckstrin homology domain-containing family M member 2, partial [Geodia barretti]